MTKREQQFVAFVWQYYRENGRHDLPWRQTSHLKPYNILVSEVMLQQTQVARVVPKYRAFLRQWPSARALADAPLADVLVAWQGLGYNRRAKYLQATAAAVRTDHRRRWPRAYEELVTLPGVGPYTAAAIRNFAYNIPTPMIETNIRTVYLHHFYHGKEHIPDTELYRYIDIHVDRANPREWFWALMDYGAYLKASGVTNNAQSRHYAKQSKFVGSDRQIRGAILRALAGNQQTVVQLTERISAAVGYTVPAESLVQQLQALESEGLLVRQKQSYRLPG